MKCIHCGAEVEKHTFCMYCGKRLIEQHVTAKPVRAASGVMRFRQRASVSESALPEVQKRQQPAARMDLESLKRISSENDRIERRAKQPGASVLSRSTESPTVANASSDASTRQSRELEALLQKLNAPENNFDPEDMLPDIEDDFSSLEVDMDSPSATNANLSDSFFIADESEAATSGPMPTGSGTFARTPSGGFHLVIDTVKNAFKKTAQRAKRFASDVRSGDISKQKVIGASAICLCAVGAVGFLASALGGSDSDSSVAQAPVAELASQSGVAGNENFAIIPIDDASDNFNDENIAQMYDFDEDAFAIPELGDDEASDAQVPIDQAAIAAAAAAAQGAIAAKPGNGTAKPVVAAVAQAETTAKTAKSTNLTEKRLYGRKDNVFAGANAPKSAKTPRACIMREGPASRFGLVKEVPAGASIKIVATTEEDWLLEKGGLWVKNGATKLGPGAQFADAIKGMSLPQPKSRVISSNNWRYIQYGDLFGYVGPACFK